MARHEMTRRDDEHAWLLETAGKLRDIGMDEAAELLDEMGKAEQRELGNRLTTIHEHLLKLAHARDEEHRRAGRGWALTVSKARTAVRKLLQDSPSLGQHVPNIHHEAYRDGRRFAEIALARQLPEEPPWTHEQALDDEFWPQGRRAPRPSTAKRRRR